MKRHKQQPYPIIEIGFSILSVLLASILTGNPFLFDRLPKTYEFFRILGTEEMWAGIFIVAALLKILGLVTKMRQIRKAGLLASTIIYGLIASTYFLGSGFFSIGFMTFGVLAFMALFSVREVDLVYGE